jgi:hypothetical protein
VASALELDVVVREVGDVVGRLALAPRPAALAQVERVEGEPAVGEEVGHRGLEEVVAEAVHVEDGPARRLRLGPGASHERGEDLALPVRVVAQRVRELLVAVAQDVGPPVGHRASSCSPGISPRRA